MFQTNNCPSSEEVCTRGLQYFTTHLMRSLVADMIQ